MKNSLFAGRRYVVGVGILGLIVGGVLALVLDAPLSWAIGFALLSAAITTGFARDRFWTLAGVAVWGIGMGTCLMIGQGADHVSPVVEAVNRLFP